MRQFAVIDWNGDMSATRSYTSKTERACRVLQRRERRRVASARNSYIIDCSQWSASLVRLHAEFRRNDDAGVDALLATSHLYGDELPRQLRRRLLEFRLQGNDHGALLLLKGLPHRHSDAIDGARARRSNSVIPYVACLSNRPPVFLYTILFGRFSEHHRRTVIERRRRWLARR